MQEIGKKQGRCLTRIKTALKASLRTLGFVALAGAAIGSAHADQNLSECIQFPGDPYETLYRMQTGQFAGQCFDSKDKRPLVLLKQSEEGSHIWVANVKHHHQFFAARIPVERVQTSLIHIETFPADVPAAHTQLRLIFDPQHPIQLVDQSSDLPLLQREVLYELNDLILSVEAGGPDGWSFDILQGIQDDFALVLSAKSLWQSAEWMIDSQNHKVQQIKLRLESWKIAQLLRNYAAKSTSMGVQHTYHTLTKNCGNELLKMIDEVADYSWYHRPLVDGNNVIDAYPVWMEQSIRVRRIHAGYFPDLGEEWPDHPEFGSYPSPE